eukprot:4528178-Amphidinium_carterae.2
MEAPPGQLDEEVARKVLDRYTVTRRSDPPIPVAYPEVEDYTHALKAMGKGKAGGPNHWRIQELPQEAHAQLVNCITRDIKAGKVTADLNKAAIAIIPKEKNKAPRIPKLRPISIYPIAFRAYLSADWSRSKGW